MKKTSIIGMLSLSLLAGITTSCEDMLTVDTGDKSYVNANDTLYSYLGIMKCMQDVAERQVILGELRGDLVSFTEYATDTLYAISHFENPADGSCSMLQASDYYNIINNCNFYIANADTSAVKSNIKYMLPEYAQVHSIRAWAYLQLVKNYGSVPFITEPISSLGIIKDFDYSANQVTKDNLVDKLLETGLADFVDTNYPSYGSWNNGFTDISSRLCFIPIRLVLGDLYLLRGAGESDYRTAAKYYYEYLRNTSSTVPVNYITAFRSRASSDGFNYASVGTWSYASTYNYLASNEVISLIPGSANKGFGTMLTRVADIFGFTPTSSQNTDVGTNDSGEEEVSTSGAISVMPTYKRQFAPSDAYLGLSDAQTYVAYERSGNVETRVDFECGDTRRQFYTYKTTYEGDAYYLCSKAASGSTFYYTIPLYRKTLVWLRLAEAINRAGFPEFAFAILKDGLNRNNMPSIVTRIIEVPVLDENGEPVLDEKGKEVTEKVEERYVATNSWGALYYAADSVRLNEFNNFLDFTGDVWAQNYGIHARGCGYALYTNQNSSTSWPGENPSTNIAGYRDSTHYAYDKLLAKQGVDVATADMSDVVDAVENIIVDELALETAFEGNRFTDLVRIAEHKNASGKNGTEWLANKVASRDVRPSKEDPTIIEGERDANIYAKLMDKQNWYFALPVWNVK